MRSKYKESIDRGVNEALPRLFVLSFYVSCHCSCKPEVGIPFDTQGADHVGCGLFGIKMSVSSRGETIMPYPKVVDLLRLIG